MSRAETKGPSESSMPADFNITANRGHRLFQFIETGLLNVNPNLRRATFEDRTDGRVWKLKFHRVDKYGKLDGIRMKTATGSTERFDIAVRTKGKNTTPYLRESHYHEGVDTSKETSINAIGLAEERMRHILGLSVESTRRESAGITT